MPHAQRHMHGQIGEPWSPSMPHPRPRPLLTTCTLPPTTPPSRLRQAQLDNLPSTAVVRHGAKNTSNLVRGRYPAVLQHCVYIPRRLFLCLNGRERLHSCELARHISVDRPEHGRTPTQPAIAVQPRLRAESTTRMIRCQERRAGSSMDTCLLVDIAQPGALQQTVESAAGLSGYSSSFLSRSARRSRRCLTSFSRAAMGLSESTVERMRSSTFFCHSSKVC